MRTPEELNKLLDNVEVDISAMVETTWLRLQLADYNRLDLVEDMLVAGQSFNYEKVSMYLVLSIIRLAQQKTEKLTDEQARNALADNAIDAINLLTEMFASKANADVALDRAKARILSESGLSPELVELVLYNERAEAAAKLALGPKDA